MNFVKHVYVMYMTVYWDPHPLRVHGQGLFAYGRAIKPANKKDRLPTHPKRNGLLTHDVSLSPRFLCNISYATPMCFLIRFYKFRHVTPKNLHTKKMHINWYAQNRIWHVVWLVQRNPTSSDTLEIELTRITRHGVTLRWHLRKSRGKT